MQSMPSVHFESFFFIIKVNPCKSSDQSIFVKAGLKNLILVLTLIVKGEDCSRTFLQIAYSPYDKLILNFKTSLITIMSSSNTN